MSEDADKGQTQGREDNAAQPVGSTDHGGAERYPPAPSDESFDPSVDAPMPPQGAGDGSPARRRA